MLLVKLYLKAHSVESIIGWELLLPIAEKIIIKLLELSWIYTVKTSQMKHDKKEWTMCLSASIFLRKTRKTLDSGI